MKLEYEYPYIVTVLALTYGGIPLADADEDDVRFAILELGLN